MKWPRAISPRSRSAETPRSRPVPAGRVPRTVCLTSQKYYFNKCSLFLLKIIWAVSMFKGSLLPKGGHLTRRFAEDMLILLCCSVGISQISPSFFGPSGGFFSLLNLVNSKKLNVKL